MATDEEPTPAEEMDDVGTHDEKATAAEADQAGVAAETGAETPDTVGTTVAATTATATKTARPKTAAEIVAEQRAREKAGAPAAACQCGWRCGWLGCAAGAEDAHRGDEAGARTVGHRAGQ